MGGLEQSWQVRWVISGFLFITGVTPLSAEPIVRRGSLDAPAADRTLGLESTGMLPVVRDALQEVRRTGIGISAPLRGIEGGDQLGDGSLLHSELREMEGLQRSARTTPSRNPDGGPDIFRDVVDDALKATREAFFDGTDTANFELAGVELSVTLTADRRALSIGGFELSGSNPETDQAREASPILVAAAGDSTNVVMRPVLNDTESPSVENILASVRKFVTHPMTIMAAIVLAGIWLVFLVAESSRSRRD